jgi:hypothetical protein
MPKFYKCNRQVALGGARSRRARSSSASLLQRTRHSCRLAREALSQETVHGVVSVSKLIYRLNPAAVLPCAVYWTSPQATE